MSVTYVVVDICKEEKVVCWARNYRPFSRVSNKAESPVDKWATISK